jgi:drug/metabolite transporter (DMT)-like permease
MNALTLGIVAGLAAALGFGVGDYLAAKASRQFSAIHATFWTQLLQLGLIVVVFFALGWRWEFKPAIIGLALAYGLVFFTGLTMAWRAFRIGPVSLASAFVSTYALVVAVIALTLLHERLTSRQELAILIMVGGAVFCSFRQRLQLSGGFWRQPTVVYALLGAAGIGGSMIIIEFMVRMVGWQSSLLMQSAGAVACSAVLLRLRGESFLPPSRRPFSLTIIACAVCMEGAAIMLTYGFSTSLVAVVAPVASISPLITVALSLIFFKEQLSRYQVGGIGAIVAGLVLLAMR